MSGSPVESIWAWEAALVERRGRERERAALLASGLMRSGSSTARGVGTSRGRVSSARRHVSSAQSSGMQLRELTDELGRALFGAGAITGSRPHIDDLGILGRRLAQRAGHGVDLRVAHHFGSA